MWYWIIGLIVGIMLLADGLMVLLHSIRQRRKYQEEANQRIAYNLAREKELNEKKAAETDSPKEPETAEISEEEMETQMARVEALFVKYGAEPLDINQRNRERFGQRQTFLYKGDYFRVDQAKFDNIPFILIDCIDDPSYAAVGVMEDVDALPVNLSDEQLDKEVRCTLGIEPYPDCTAEQA